jgi:Transcriptional regulator, AbiEi antitoxin
MAPMPEPVRIMLGNRATSEPVRAIAREQEGVVTRAALLATGVSSAAIGRALAGGRLYRLLHGVYSVTDPDLLSEDAHLVAALLAAGDGAMLGCATAAWRWQLIPAPPVAIELIAPRPRKVEGVTVLLSRLRAPAT